MGHSLLVLPGAAPAPVHLLVQCSVVTACDSCLALFGSAWLCAGGGTARPPKRLVLFLSGGWVLRASAECRRAHMLSVPATVFRDAAALACVIAKAAQARCWGVGDAPVLLGCLSCSLWVCPCWFLFVGGAGSVY